VPRNPARNPGKESGCGGETGGACVNVVNERRRGDDESRSHRASRFALLPMDHGAFQCTERKNRGRGVWRGNQREPSINRCGSLRIGSSCSMDNVQSKGHFYIRDSDNTTQDDAIQATARFEVGVESVLINHMVVI